MFKEEAIHFSLSIVAGAIVSWVTGNFWAIPVALLSGFFIDTDHIFDYLMYTKGRNLNLREFFSGQFFDTAGKVYTLFHGYEYALIFIIIGKIFPVTGWVFYALGLSMILHLIYDTISNKPIWPTYFILYRLYYRFDHDHFAFKKDKN